MTSRALRFLNEFRNKIQTVNSNLDKKIVQIENCINSMYGEFILKETGYLEMMKNYFMIILTMIERIINAEESKVKGKFDTKILDFINDNIQEKITLRDAAKVTFYSEAYFSHLFKERFVYQLL